VGVASRHDAQYKNSIQRTTNTFQARGSEKCKNILQATDKLLYRLMKRASINRKRDMMKLYLTIDMERYFFVNAMESLY